MANEFRFRYSSTGVVLYTQLIRGTDGQIWNGSAFASLLTANWTTYAVTMTEQSTTRYYYGSMPAVAAGLYDYFVFLRSGGTPAVTDTLLGQGRIDWTGTVDAGVGNVSLAATGLDNIVIETGLNARQALALIAAAESGILSGATAGTAPATVTIKGSGVVATRIVATCDANGNRTALTLTPPA